MQELVLLLIFTVALVHCKPPPPPPSIQVKRRIEPQVASNFHAQMQSFLSHLPSTSSFQPHHNCQVNLTTSSDLSSSSSPWQAVSCKSLNLKFKYERNLSPGHTRSSVYLVRTQTGQPLVRKIHGYAHSFANELKFYKRVKHVLVSAAVCWEPIGDKDAFNVHSFLDKGGARSTFDSNGDSSSHDYSTTSNHSFQGDNDDSYYYNDYDRSSSSSSSSSSSYSSSSSSSSSYSSSPSPPPPLLEQQKIIGKVNSGGKKSDKALLIEYVPGGQSGDWLYELGFQELDEHKSEQILRRLISQFIDAVQAIHQAGMVHGDIKPENILITQTSLSFTAEVRLIDFDLSASAKSPRLRAGTRTTMSPEVAMVIGGPVNEASDWWSVGVTVLMWTISWRCGKMQQQGIRGDKLERVCNYRPFQFIRLENRIAIKSIPTELDIPEKLGKLIAMLLDPNPERRQFVCKEDLDLLRGAFDLKSGDYSRTKRYQKADDISPSTRNIRVRHRHSRSMQAINSDTNHDEPRCDEYECIKDGQEPLFLRRPLE